MPILTLFALLMHKHIPLKVEHLLPVTDPDDQYIYADKNTGGISSVDWLDEKKLNFRCNMIESDVDEYCAFVRKLGDGEVVGLDLTNYKGFRTKINYTGNQSHLRLFIRHFDSQFSQNPKYQSIVIKTKEFENEVDVEFESFSVAPWWILEVNLPHSSTLTQFSNVILIGIDLPAPVAFGYSEFQIEYFDLYGEWITKEQWYFAIAIFWIIAFVLLGIYRFLHLEHKSAIQINQSKNALRTSEERLNIALVGGREGIWELDIEAQLIYIERGGCEISQINEKQITMSLVDFQNIIHLEDKKRVKLYFDSFDLSKDNNIFGVEFRTTREIDNDYCWLQLKGALAQSNDKEDSKKIIGTIANITDDKKADEQLQLYASAFNNSTSGISILDKRFFIVATNKAFSHITGFSFEEVIGKPPTFITLNNNPLATPENVDKQIADRGFWTSEIISRNKNGEHFIMDVELNPVINNNKNITHYVCIFSDVTKKKKSEEDLWTMANHDILTGLPNRGLFRKKLEKTILKTNRDNETMALLFLDLDKFKQVNDTLGHEAGDELLKKIASFLNKSIHKGDTVARLGGDEFAIILENIGEKKNIERIANQLMEPFIDGFYINNKNSGVGLSIGISLYPQNADNSDNLLRCADTAMYHSKTHEDEKINFYSISMSEHINRRNLLEQELRIAIETNDESLCIYFQPQINVKTSTVIGFEALSRWIHPTLGTISPEEFIPIAEDSGLIIPLGRRVIRQACQQLKQCHAQGYNDLRIAVNISAKQFLLANVPLDVLEIIESENIDAKYLELELTESLVVDNPEKTIVMLTALKEMGIRLSIDDFGTGYSSLSYLSQFPLDILKIDKSFINQMETNNKGLALTQTIIAIAHNLSLEVVAEGVETEQQLNLLRKLSCEYVQGYFFSKPIPASEITSLLEKKWD